MDRKCSLRRRLSQGVSALAAVGALVAAPPAGATTPSVPGPTTSSNSNGTATCDTTGAVRNGALVLEVTAASYAATPVNTAATNVTCEIEQDGFVVLEAYMTSPGAASAVNVTRSIRVAPYRQCVSGFVEPQQNTGRRPIPRVCTSSS